MVHFACLFANSLFEKSDKSGIARPGLETLCDKKSSIFAPNHTHTRRQRRHMSTPPHPRGSHGPVQRPGELPRPRVRLGYDLHGLRACECIEKMLPFLVQAAAQASTRVVPTRAGRRTAHSAWDATKRHACLAAWPCLRHSRHTGPTQLSVPCCTRRLSLAHLTRGTAGAHLRASQHAQRSQRHLREVLLAL